jgi:hypothetical protein
MQFPSPVSERHQANGQTKEMSRRAETQVTETRSGGKRRSKVHMAVDTLGHLLALKVTAANEQERARVSALAAEVQAVTGQSVELAFVDQGCTGSSFAWIARFRRQVMVQSCEETNDR